MKECVKMKMAMRKLFSILFAAMLVMCFMPVAAAEQGAYVPNRSITIQNVSGEQPIIQMGMVPFNLGENGGPYHVFGKVKIENFEKIDSSKPARAAIIVYYGNSGTSPEKEVLLREWTADTDGWQDMVSADGRHIELEDFEDYGDAILRFTLQNAKGNFGIADLIIADNKDEIVYSLANDPQFTGITSYWTRLGVNHLWTPYYIDNVNSFVTVESKIQYDYTPNYVLRLSIPPNAEGVEPVVNAYVNTNFGTRLSAENAPYTMYGMIKVENFAPNLLEGYSSFSNLARFFTGHDMGRVYSGNTGGWVPLLTPEGTPYVLKTGTDNLVEKLMDYWQMFGSWGAVGDFYLADLTIIDKDGNVAYSFETDPDLVEQEYNLATGLTYLNLWYGFNGGNAGKYIFTVNPEPVEHELDEYLLKTVEETYVPYTEPTEPTDETGETTATTPNGTTTTKQQENVKTGVGLNMTAFACFGMALAVILILQSKRKTCRQTD